jgi:hypothetical protein
MNDGRLSRGKHTPWRTPRTDQYGASGHRTPLHKSAEDSEPCD